MMEETTCKPDYSNSMAEHLGIRFLPSTEDAVHAEMPVDHRTSQPFGMLNGGASLALAEIVAGHGSTSLCREGEYACGVQVSGNHLSAVPVGGKVFATGKLIHRGRSSHKVSGCVLVMQEDLWGSGMNWQIFIINILKTIEEKIHAYCCGPVSQV